MSTAMITRTASDRNYKKEAETKLAEEIKAMNEDIRNRERSRNKVAPSERRNAEEYLVSLKKKRDGLIKNPQLRHERLQVIEIGLRKQAATAILRSK